MRQYSYSMAFAACALLIWPAATAHARTDKKPPARPPAAHIAPTGSTAPAGSTGFVGETGAASYYGKAHHGRRTASGARFDQEGMTAAHPWLPFGAKVRVTNMGNGKSVVVVVTDRLYSNHRVVDLSVGAARQLGMMRQGVATVSIVPA